MKSLLKGAHKVTAAEVLARYNDEWRPDFGEPLTDVNQNCRDMRQIWDDKYSPGEHAKDIRDLTRGILRDQKNIDRYCK
jgi:hypothetical protein